MDRLKAGWRVAAKLIAGIILCWLVASRAAAAQRVVPADRVHQAVTIFAGPSGSEPEIGQLMPHESVTLDNLANAGWYGVRLADGRLGYVSRGWTVLVDGAASTAPQFHLHLIDVGTGLSVFVEGPGFNLPRSRAEICRPPSAGCAASSWFPS